MTVRTRARCEDMVPIHEDVVQPAEEEDVGPSCQAADCEAKVDDGQLQFPGIPPVHPGRTQPVLQGAHPSAMSGSGGGG